MSFFDEVYAASVPRETKADIVEYYQEKFPKLGKGGWKQHLIHDLLGMQEITPANVGDASYKRYVKNMGKRFESRLNNPEPRNAEQYRELGEQLPRRAPGGGYHIEGVIWVKYSQECVERHVDEDITGDDAKTLASMASAQMLQGLINYYQTGDTTQKGPDACDEPDLTVEAIEE